MFSWVFSFWKTISWAILILLLMSIPTTSMPVIAPVFHPDKLIHVMLFALFMMIWIGECNKTSLSRIKNKDGYTINEKFSFKTYSLLSSFPILYGITMELLQHYIISGRHGSWQDMLANTIGVILGGFIWYLVKK
jgi:hypothetical protein